MRKAVSKLVAKKLFARSFRALAALALSAGLAGSGWCADASPAETPAAAPAPNAAEPAATPAPAGPNAFELVWKRNIFDQSRSPRVGRREERAATRKAPVVESFGLVGTMSFSGGLVAFFNSEKTALRKSAKQGEQVGDFKVVEIGHSSVRLLRDTEEFNLEIGRQIKREDDGPWELSKEVVAIAEPIRPVEKPAESSSGGGVADLLKRLREKREKEMKP